MGSRPDLHDASSSDSDLYEELLVNPTLLTLATHANPADHLQAILRVIADHGQPAV